MTDTTLLAIDPGNTESGWCLIDTKTRAPLRFDKTDNHDLISDLWRGDIQPDTAAIEMVASYGMPVGAEVFDTCVWIGRFTEALNGSGVEPTPVKRQPIKIHHCHSPKANDATVKRALVDRFAYGQPNYGKGTKASPGWFHGFRADIWQAYALAVYYADQIDPPTAPF